MKTYFLTSALVMFPCFVWAGHGAPPSPSDAIDKAVLNDPVMTGQGNASIKADAQLLQWADDHLSVAAGPAFFLGNHGGSETAPSLNVRLRHAPWSVEVGGNLPISVAGNFQMVQQSINGAQVTANVTSIAEAHIAAHWEVPHGQQDVIVPDLGFGVSAMKISDRIVSFDAMNPSFDMTTDQSRTAFSPLFEAGLHFFAEHRISASVDFAYVSYSNVPSYGTAFDLGLTGWMIRPVLQVRL